MVSCETAILSCVAVGLVALFIGFFSGYAVGKFDV